ncbi:MAG: hypothetical protein ACREAA_02155 [Candidatus Polarisedimenticolia bacterium]
MPSGPGSQSSPLIAFSLGAVVAGLTAYLITIKACCPPALSPPSAHLVIEDDHNAVWMAVDNGFTQPAAGSATAWAKRVGLLLQLGTFWEYLDDAGWTYQPYMESGTVTLIGDAITTPLVLEEDDFTWLNIVGEKPGAPADPISVEVAGLLFEDASTTTGCLTDTCSHNMPPPGYWTCADPLTTLPLSCVRIRSLHAHFRATRMITYWQGTNAYSTQAAQVANPDPITKDPRCNRYIFSLMDPVTVTAWLGNTPAAAVNAEIAKLGKIKSITVDPHAEVDHGEAHDPPTTIRR